MIPDPDLTATELEPTLWERQPAESRRAYAAFARYRDLGPLRTMRRAAGLLYHDTDDPALCTGPQLAQLKEWSRTLGWAERVGAWDDHLDVLARATQEQAAQTMRAAWALVGEKMRDEIVRTLEARTLENELLSPNELVRFAEVGLKTEAFGREIPPEVKAPVEVQAVVLERAEKIELGRQIARELYLVEDPQQETADG